jgi:hypothetical protein
MGGFTWWIEMRNLPASLCFQWALSGALYNDDYAAAARLMKIPVRTSSSDEPKVAAAKYPMNLLDSSLEWKILNDCEKRKLPHSAFLESLFQREASDVVLDESEIIPLFDKTEILIAMQYAYLRSSEEHGWFWTPLGQFIFRDRADFRDKLAAYENLENGAPLLKAGLLGGTSESAKVAAQAFREFLDKHAGSLFY